MLTPSQLAALKADILADGALNAFPNTADGNFEIAKLYNLAASPAFTVWRTNVTAAQCRQAMVWTEFVGRSQGERDAWVLMLQSGTINAADANVRQGIQDIFSGPSGATSRANLTQAGKRLATRAEKLFATGTGTDNSPATMTFEGTLSLFDVEEARRS